MKTPSAQMIANNLMVSHGSKIKRITVKVHTKDAATEIEIDTRPAKVEVTPPTTTEYLPTAPLRAFVAGANLLMGDAVAIRTVDPAKSLLAHHTEGLGYLPENKVPA